MSRNTGTFNFAANLEVLAKAPLDAKQLVGTKADLTGATTWNASGSVWLYDGAIVSVGSDPIAENNGIYWLSAATNYTNTNSWIKAGTGEGGGTITGGTNGLSTVGANIVLGGDLTGGTTIIDGLGVANLTLNQINDFQITPSGSTNIVFGVDETGILLSLSGGTIAVTFDDNGGLKYGDDYSLNYTDRSLIDKAYADAIVSGLKPKAAVHVATTVADGNIAEYPVLTSPSLSSFTINPSTTLYEVGTSVSITGTASFNAGSISPVYPPTACGDRTDGVFCYIYNAFASPYESIINGPSVGDSCPFLPSTVVVDSNYISAKVCYCCGVQPYDSSGNPFGSPLNSGVTNTIERIITGVYPVYYGKLASGTRPAVTLSLVTGGTKSVVPSTGTVTIDFDSVSQYTWLAIPSGATNSKYCWYVNPSNNGCMNCSVSDKYPDECIISISSALWSGINYKVYMSKSQWSDPDPIQFRNS